MSLTTARLNELAQVGPDDTRPAPRLEEYDELIEAARESVARQELRAILPDEFEIWLHEQDAEFRGTGLAWTVTAINGEDQTWVYGATPSAAYIAARAAFASKP